MAIIEQLGAAKGFFAGGLSRLAQLKWVFIILMIIAVLGGVIFFLKRANDKKKQWTHKIKVQRLLQNGTLTEPVIHKARRFPLEKGVEMFELEKPIIGSYLIPQPGPYTDVNTFSIMLDSNNRIWNVKRTRFDKEKESMNVSAVHAGIDVEMAAMKDKWQQAHKVNKKITNAELIKAGLKALGIVAIVILGIVAIQEWGDAQVAKAQMSQAEAEAMNSINEAVQTMQKVVNTQQLQIIPMLKALYKTDDLSNIINNYRPEENEV